MGKKKYKIKNTHRWDLNYHQVCWASQQIYSEGHPVIYLQINLAAPKEKMKETASKVIRRTRSFFALRIYTGEDGNDTLTHMQGWEAAGWRAGGGVSMWARWEQSKEMSVHVPWRRTTLIDAIRGTRVTVRRHKRRRRRSAAMALDWCARAEDKRWWFHFVTQAH